jgi:hypothetical protein
MKLRVGIIGGGSASMVCAATVYGQTPPGCEFSITLITDPNIPPIRVGESMSPMLVGIMDRCLKFIFPQDNSVKNVEEMCAMPRIGARHTWEDNAHEPFDVNYNTFAFHIDSSKFVAYARRRMGELYDYKEINDTIVDITQTEGQAIAHSATNQYSFDYIFDCRGFPTPAEFNSGQYRFPEFETVNSLMVFQNKGHYTHCYTDNIIHRNGWQFGINTTERKAFGYLYNRNITSDDEALKHYLQLNKNVPIVESEIKQVKWKFYFAARPVDGRVMKMGNKLFFFEPIQGIPLHHYSIYTSMLVDYMFACEGFFQWDYRGLLGDFKVISCANSPEEACNEFHHTTMRRYFQILCTNYIGNQMDSDFWNITKSKCMDKLLRSEEFVDFAKRVIEHYETPGSIYPDLHLHQGIIIKQYMRGLNVDFQGILNTISRDSISP